MDLENLTNLKAIVGLCQHQGCLRKGTHEIRDVDNPDFTINLYETHYKQTNDEK